MTEFTLTILRDFIKSGYQYIIYKNMEHFALLAPGMSAPNSIEDGYVLSIDDEQVWEMSGGVNEFSFYVLL